MTQSEGAKVVGLVPAAGRATRLGEMPCSKEVLPLRLFAPDDAERVPRLACHYVLQRMHQAGANRAFVVIRDGKWDIPHALGDGQEIGLSVAYLMMRLPHGVPYTLDQAYAFVEDAVVLFGFPDVFFKPEDSFARLQAELHGTEADVVLGLYPARNPHKADMVAVDAAGFVESIHIKPPETDLTLAWVNAAWGPRFTAFMHNVVAEHQAQYVPSESVVELHTGHVLQAALREGLAVRALSFPKHSFIDIGTRAELRLAAQGKWE